jgi:hypothetical protein
VRRLKLTKPLKLLALIAGVAFLDIITLSPGLLGVRIGGENVLETASGITVLFMSLIVLLYGSYGLLLKPPAHLPPIKSIRTHEDYIAALHPYRKVKVLKNNITQAIDQIYRIEKKKSTLVNVLSQRFEQTELSYRRFSSVIGEVEKLFYLNIRGILNKLHVYEASGFAIIADHVTGYLGANEEILLKLDQLLLEISMLGSTDYDAVEEMPCMKEIDQLITQTKFYKP